MVEGPYTVEESVVGVGGGAFSTRCRILDDEGNIVMLSSRQELTFMRREDAQAFTAALNLGALALRRGEAQVHTTVLPMPWEKKNG